MYTMITERPEIDRLQKRFQEILTSQTEKVPDCKTAIEPKHPVDAYWSSSLGIWVGFGLMPVPTEKKKTNRYWNVFGLHQPSSTYANVIDVEINFSFDGSARAAGAFVKDASGKIFVTHNGNINRAKEAFYASKNLHFVNLAGKNNKVALVGELEAADFPERVRDFAREVKRIKDSAA